MQEYDFAKIYFALTGYDIFDNINIYNFNEIDLIFEKYPFYSKKIILSFVISIWLGNSHI